MQSSHQQSCLEILNNLQSEKYYDKTRYFLSPVQETIDESEWQLYKTIIKTPKDLGTIHEHLSQNKYNSISAFSKDVNLCFENAIKYNKQRYKPVYQAALALQKVFNTQMDKLVSSLPRGLSIPAPTVPPPAPVAVASPAIVNFDSAVGNAILDTISGLKAARWFTVPIDLTMQNYTKRILSPIDLPTIREKLQKRKYTTPDQFALDVRRTFANCLVYNFEIGASNIRNDAKVCLLKFEQEWKKVFDGSVAPPLSNLKECLDSIEEVLKLTPEGATAPSIIAFIDPVKLYYEGNTAWQKKYSQIIKKPMDYGTIISGICEARYSTIEEVLADARLVAENCEKYSSVTMKITAEEVRRTDPLTMEAWALYHRFQEEISSRVPTKVLEVEPNEDIDENELPPEIPKLKVSKSKRGSSLGTVEEPKEKKAVSKKNLKSQVKVENGESSQTSSPAPPKKSKVNINVKDRYLWCLSELKAHHLKNDIGVDVQTCWPFNLAVDPIQYPTYLVVISNPMDLSMMEKKVKGEKYPQLISILRDMELIRDNAHTFNPGDLGKDIRYMADLTLSNFKFLLKQVALEILNCGDETFIQKYIPQETVEYLLKPEPLEEISSAFYLPRLSPTTTTDSAVEEKPTLSRKKSLSKQTNAKTIVVDNQLSNEEVGYLLSQEDNGWINETEPPFDYNDEFLVDIGTVARPTPGKKAHKGKRKKSGSSEELIEPSLLRLPSTISPMAQWEQDCFDMLKKITRHEFLDLTKPNPKVFKADFFHPVIELFPDLATSYLQEIKNPMDFSIIYDRLTRHGFLDCQDVYEKIILIFQNTIDFNEPHIHENDHSPDAEFARKMVSRSKHMIKYVKWVANEMLPVIDDSNELHPEALGELRTSLRDEYRKERMDIITNAPIDVHRDCNSLLKKFENRKYMKDYLYFSRPVPIKDVHDYLVYVRHPMDFYTVKEKLDKHKYPTFGHFIKDLRLIFSNAKTYNKVHMETDPVSKSCYESAVLLSEKLETWLLEDFSIDVAERVLYNNIKIAEGAIIEAQKKEIKEKMDQELDEFRKQEIARMKSTDLMFAADQLRREYISGTLEPGTNINILTPRAPNTDRPPLFYEPETVEIAISQLHATSQAHQPHSKTANEAVRENVWDYWRSQGFGHEKLISNFPDAMELVRSDSDSRISRNDSRDSHESSSLKQTMEGPPVEVAPSSQKIESNTIEAISEDLHIPSFQLKPLQKKIKTCIDSTASKRSPCTLKKSSVLLIPFVDDELVLPPTTVTELDHAKSSRTKRNRESQNTSADHASQSKKLRKDEERKDEEDDVSLAHPSAVLEDLTPFKSPQLDLRNIFSSLSSNGAVSIVQLPGQYPKENFLNSSESETIVMRYQTCNRINLFRILTPCFRVYDDINSIDDDGVIGSPTALEEQKSQSSSISESVNLGRESSSTFSDHSPHGVTNSTDQSINAANPQLLELSQKNITTLPKVAGSEPSGLLLRSLSAQAAINAKRKSDIDNVRKILSSTNRSALEQKFKVDFFRKKLLGVFGDKKASEELRKRAVSLMKAPSEGTASIHHFGTRLHIVFPLKSSVHLHPSMIHANNSEIHLTITPPSSKDIISGLFGSPYPTQSLSLYSDLYTAGFEVDRGLSNELTNKYTEYTACFTSDNKPRYPFRRWYPRSDTSCTCHISHENNLDSYLRIQRHSTDSNLYSVKSTLPIAGLGNDVKHTNHWSPKISLTLQQISNSTFISPSCQEVSYVKKMKNNENEIWQKYVEIWIMFIGDYHPDPSYQSRELFPTVDLIIK